MVAEVEKIVRSIEDEKIQQEERDKTRDVLARIEGLEKNKVIIALSPTRFSMKTRITILLLRHSRLQRLQDSL